MERSSGQHKHNVCVLFVGEGRMGAVAEKEWRVEKELVFYRCGCLSKTQERVMRFRNPKRAWNLSDWRAGCLDDGMEERGKARARNSRRLGVEVKRKEAAEDLGMVVWW